MSATIPETMPLSDLLKSTGYDCPEDLQGKTFAEATAGGDVSVETNKTATIDVSSYTEPVVITPTEGKDAMAKATVTLSNIPSPEVDLETNKAATIDVSTYTEPAVIRPTEGKDGMEQATVTLTNIPANRGWSWSKQVTGSSDITYVILPFDKAPETMASHDATDKQYFGYKLVGKSISSVRYGTTIPESNAEETITDLVYTKVSDTSFKVAWTSTVTSEEPVSCEVTYTYSRPIFSTNPWD